MSECAELCEQIAKLPVNDLAGLALRYRALLWELIEDDLILDHGRELEGFSDRAQK